MKVIVFKNKEKKLKPNSKSFKFPVMPWTYEVHGFNKMISYGYAHSKEQAIGSGLNLAEEIRDSKGYYKNVEIDVVVR
jgi:hypothetical protein